MSVKECARLRPGWHRQVQSDVRQTLQVLRPQSRSLGNSAEHARSDLVAIVKCEDVVWPAWAGEYAVGPLGLTLDGSADLQQGGEHLPGFG
jgi:hypothetical protein